jgi:transposase-like protein
MGTSHQLFSIYRSYPSIYTTNTLEGYHRQIREITKTKGVFLNDAALKKLVYLRHTAISIRNGLCL